MARKAVGYPVPAKTGISKVTGSGRFPPDIDSTNCLHAAVLKSDVPHAVITDFDPTPALQVPGVEVVLSREELGLDSTVRHVGDVVAAVAAESQEQAAKAVTALRVSFDRQPSVTNPTQALQEGAPLLDPKKDSNLALLVEYSLGETTRSFEEAAVVYEADYWTGRPTHCNLSPRVCFALAADALEVHTSVDAPQFAQRELAHLLDLPVESVRIVLPQLMTSSFGGRSSINRHCEPITARLAMALPGRRIRLSYDPISEFVCGTTRHSTSAHIKAGATSSGRLLALEVDLIADHGPYDNFVNRIVLNAGRDRALDIWSMEHYEYRGRAVLTNNLMAGEMRGIGATQINYLLGSHMDELARQVGVDPLEFHLLNLAESARSDSAGGLEECLRRGAKAFDWKTSKEDSNPIHTVGRGVGVGTHTTGLGTFHGPDTASAVVAVDRSRISISTAAPDSGQGFSTVAAQIAAEELGIDIDLIDVTPIDTASAPDDPWGSVASRATYVVGSAVRLAAADLKDQLLEVPGASGGESRDIQSVIVELEQRLEGRGTAVIEETPPTYGAYFVEVEVDQNTGDISVRRIVAAIDVGFAVNPAQCRGQVEGAIAHGIEFALGADVVMKDGFPENPTLVDYRVARSGDMPEIEVILIEGGDTVGPYGARGIGTPAITPVLPAVANAVRDAIDDRLRSIPMYPEDVANSLVTKAN